MDQYKIDNEIRLMALETVLVHVAKVAFLTSGVTEAGISEWRKDAIKKLGSQTLPGIDPALSDHCSAELQVAVDQLISQIQSAVSTTMSQLRGESGRG